MEDLDAATMRSREDREILLKLVKEKWRCESVSASLCQTAVGSATILFTIYSRFSGEGSGAWLGAGRVTE